MQHREIATCPWTKVPTLIQERRHCHQTGSFQWRTPRLAPNPFPSVAHTQELLSRSRLCPNRLRQSLSRHQLDRGDGAEAQVFGLQYCAKIRRGWRLYMVRTIAVGAAAFATLGICRLILALFARCQHARLHVLYASTPTSFASIGLNFSAMNSMSMHCDPSIKRALVPSLPTPCRLSLQLPPPSQHCNRRCRCNIHCCHRCCNNCNHRDCRNTCCRHRRCNNCNRRRRRNT
jgi:hypothetical protein